MRTISQSCSKCLKLHIYVNSSLISPASLRSQDWTTCQWESQNLCLPMLISHKGNIFTSWTSLIQLENSSCSIESQDTARETRFWDTREKWSKEPVLTMIRKGKKKKKKLITDSPGRKIRSRELKVCRFPQFKHFRGKSRRSPRPRTELSFPPLLPPALSSLRMWCSKHISAYWKYTFKGNCTAL